jgi:periplasmic protein TonB
MFDKLIESNSAGAEFKPRRKFFMVSSVVVGIAFLSAVVFSLYAQDIDLGTDSFDFAELIAPVAPDAPEPEPPRAQPEQARQQTKSELPSRKDLIARIDQPHQIPDQISTIPSTLKPIPEGRFVLDPHGPETERTGSYSRDGTGVSAPGSEKTEVAEVVKVVEPPPIVPKPEPRKPVTLSKGVVNGTAKYLPKPPYPAAARAIGITGDVNVQVLINEEGDVVSAQAITGHVTLKAEAERAARRAKFRPTLLSDQPVKVTGVIIYRFSR